MYLIYIYLYTYLINNVIINGYSVQNYGGYPIYVIYVYFFKHQLIIFLKLYKIKF